MTDTQSIVLSIVLTLAVVVGVSVFLIRNYNTTPPSTNNTTNTSTTAKESAENETTDNQSNSQNNSQTMTQNNTEKLEIKDEVVGTGKEVKSGDIVVINYTGKLLDGTIFDSSLKPGRTPFETQIGVGRVIQGWDQGVVGMKVGGKRTLTIPPSLGYGSQPQGSIPANSTLIFELELLEVK